MLRICLVLWEAKPPAQVTASILYFQWEPNRQGFSNPQLPWQRYCQYSCFGPFNRRVCGSLVGRGVECVLYASCQRSIFSRKMSVKGFGSFFFLRWFCYCWIFKGSLCVLSNSHLPDASLENTPRRSITSYSLNSIIRGVENFNEAISEFTPLGWFIHYLCQSQCWVCFLLYYL